AVVAAYPVASVLEIPPQGHLFARRAFVVGGEELTLDEIEHARIRSVRADPRVHFVLNCGAASCPPLERHAFDGEHLEVRLEEAARRFAGTPTSVRLDRERGVLHLSRIIDWYRRDFGAGRSTAGLAADSDRALVDYLMPLLPDSTRTYLQGHPGVDVAFEEYDWTLNDQAPSRPGH
ncbi:MAG: DUF547 domain-containing protein, partial [Candidatus Latescibacterota bacterium]